LKVCQFYVTFHFPFSIFHSVLPRCFADAGDLTFVGEVSEADTADAEVTQISVGATADFATVVAAR